MERNKYPNCGYRFAELIYKCKENFALCNFETNSYYTYLKHLIRKHNLTEKGAEKLTSKNQRE